MTESFGFGRAGVVWARTRLGRPVADADLDALEASLDNAEDDPGLYTGRAGVALALVGAGRPDAARRAAASALTESMDSGASTSTAAPRGTAAALRTHGPSSLRRGPLFTSGHSWRPTRDFSRGRC